MNRLISFPKQSLPARPSVHEQNLVTYTESPTSLPCPTCGSAIDLSSVEWCQCVTKPLSVVCPSCRHCSCKLRELPIVLTDALMPKIDGRQLCRLIKAVNRSIKVVIMSGLYKSTRYRIEAMKAFHADEYLAKPIDFARLQQVLGKLAVKAAA